MNGVDRQPPDPARRAATQLAGYLAEVPVGAALPLDPSSDLCAPLERLVPDILRRTHPEWRGESLDGFYFASAVKTDEQRAELAGTCILISDQTVTPFALTLILASREEFASVRIRLGEPGTGPLGISGPPCNSSAASTMLYTLTGRLDQVDWVYDTTTQTDPF